MGRDNVIGDDKNLQGNLEFSAIRNDHDYCGVSPGVPEYGGRLGISKHSGFLRVDVETESVQNPNKEVGNTNNRPVCIETIKTSPNIFLVETRPICQGSGCHATAMASETDPLCISPFFNDKQDTEEGDTRSNINFDNSHPNLADSAVVSSVIEPVQAKSSFVTPGTRSSDRTQSKPTPVVKEQNVSLGSLDSFRRNLATQGISEKAADLIVSSRRDGTNSTYSSAWNKWTSWCSEKQIDPFRCLIKYILNYLAGMFEAKYEYSTICFHRSAISAFHDKVEGLSVGDHPQVSALIAGVFNKRPPQPRYCFIWDVQKVIDYIKSNLAANSELTDKLLTLKLTMLLALTSASRVLGLQHLDTNFMALSDDSVVFNYGQLHKGWRKGKPPPSVTFVAYPHDRDICILTTLKAYLERTKPWRVNDNYSQLLLSFIKPHKPISSDTIARWLKIF